MSEISFKVDKVKLWTKKLEVGQWKANKKNVIPWAFVDCLLWLSAPLQTLNEMDAYRILQPNLLQNDS